MVMAIIIDHTLFKSSSILNISREAGLPNITGDIGMDVSFHTPSGAFNSIKKANTSYAYYAKGDYSVELDASRSSSIYGNSSTVQPNSISTLIIIKY